MENELATINTMYLAPAASLAEAAERYNAFKKFVETILVKGQDYGEIPGVSKPTLLKPGAEKLNSFFGLSAKFTLVDSEKDWTGQNHGSEPFFYFEYRCDLYRGDQFVASCDGSCNSWEKKYRYRWMNELDVPSYIDKSKLEYKDGTISEFKFSIEKGETSGKYGKPAEYWKQFRDAIANGTARKVMKRAKDREYEAYEIGGKIYAVPNHDVADQVNTIQKMAQKRAFVGASLIATNASEFFTQDIEDMPRESISDAIVIEGDFISQPVKQQTAPPKTQEPDWMFDEQVDQPKKETKTAAFNEEKFLKNFNPPKDFQPMPLDEAKKIESEKDGTYATMTTEKLFYRMNSLIKQLKNNQLSGEDAEDISLKLNAILTILLNRKMSIESAVQ